MRASTAGLAASRKLFRPDWYIAMLSGMSFSCPSRPGRRGRAGRRLELSRAVTAVADSVPAKPAPTVVGEPLRMCALDDLGQDGWDVFIVVGAVYATDVLLRGPVWSSCGIHAEP